MRLLACLLVLGAVPAQARKPSEYLGTYHLTGHLAGSACSFADLETPRVVFPQLTITRAGRHRAVRILQITPFPDSPVRNSVSLFRYRQRVRGRFNASSWSMKQVDTCVLFTSPPPRRCASIRTEMAGLPDAEQAVRGSVVLGFHHSLRKPDCFIRWEGGWTR